ncbi:MAG: GNAT family N-acetyltransferase [Acidobacteriota bacterium]|nr:GNAT family N-acetyltransferase [Acidobacteriota bacterium]
MQLEPVALEGRRVRLEPLSLDHHAALCEIGLEPVLWRWTISEVLTPEDMRAYIESALQSQQGGTALPFATIDKAAGRAVGSTRFMNIDKLHRRVEIGSTWIGSGWQRTGVNTEAKYLMLRHAFEILGCIRIELKTDSFNQQSRNAILRLGAREEGIFRNHMICYGGRIRHSAWYSVIDSEWPEVKARLENFLIARQ